MSKLLDLKDVASRPRLVAAIRRLQLVRPRSLTMDPDVLAQRLAHEMPEPQEPK